MLNLKNAIPAFLLSMSFLAATNVMATTEEQPIPENPHPGLKNPQKQVNRQGQGQQQGQNIGDVSGKSKSKSKSSSSSEGGASDAEATGGEGGTGNGTVNTSLNSKSRALGLAFDGIQVPVVVANPGNTPCPSASSSGWSVYIFGKGKTKSGVDNDCLDKLGKQASDMADKTAFYDITKLLIQSGKKDEAAYALSAFRKANANADAGAAVVVENIVKCGMPLIDHPYFSVLSTQPSLTCPAAYAPAEPQIIEKEKIVIRYRDRPVAQKPPVTPGATLQIPAGSTISVINGCQVQCSPAAVPLPK